MLLAQQSLQLSLDCTAAIQFMMAVCTRIRIRVEGVRYDGVDSDFCGGAGSVWVS